MALFLQDGTPLLLQDGTELLLQSDNLAVLGPTDKTIADDQTVTFEVVAVNPAGTPTYQWYEDAVLMGGETASTLTFFVDWHTQNGSVYYCAVTDDVTTVNSANATLTITKKPLVWTVDAQSATVVDGVSHDFTVLADAEPTVTYQWYKNAVLMGGETSTTLSVTAVLADTGDEYYCEATDGYGDVTASATATLTVVEEQGLGDLDFRIKTPDNQWIRITQPQPREYVLTGSSTRTPGGSQTANQRLVCTNTGAATITLTGFAIGASVQVIRTDAVVTIDGSGTLINGQATQQLPSQWDAANLLLTSVGWVAI